MPGRRPACGVGGAAVLVAVWCPTAVVGGGDELVESTERMGHLLDLGREAVALGAQQAALRGGGAAVVHAGQQRRDGTAAEAGRVELLEQADHLDGVFGIAALPRR